MKHALRKLPQWQRSEGLTDAEAGARFGVTRMTWLRWKSGLMIPTPPSMRQLFAAEVAEPNDFYDLPELQVSLPLKAAA